MRIVIAPLAVLAGFLAALPTAVRYEVAGPSLDLLTAEGTFVVTFTRARER